MARIAGVGRGDLDFILLFTLFHKVCTIKLAGYNCLDVNTPGVYRRFSDNLVLLVVNVAARNIGIRISDSDINVCG